MTTAVQWTKLVITGVPGMECNVAVTPEGWALDYDGDPLPLTDRTQLCGAPGAWMVGRVFLCSPHAADVARVMGDSIEAIDAAWRGECL